MKLITLQAIPNQTVIVTLDSRRYEIEIKFTGEFMTCGMLRDGEVIFNNGFRIVNGAPLIPYKYLESGNFAFQIPDNETPNYENFQSTQFLFYATQEEIEAVR